MKKGLRMQGADLVNGELEVGFDETFEKRWHRAEQVGRVVMFLFVLAGLAGLLGQGPYSHRTNQTSDMALAVDFEPIARSQTGTQVTFRFNNDTSLTTRKLFISSHVIEPMGLKQVVPQPVNSQAVDGGMMLSLAVPPGTKHAMVRLMLQPSGAVGVEHFVARLDDHPTLQWTQTIVP